MITCSPISNNDHRTSDDDDDDEEISDDSDDMEDDIHANRPRKIHQAMNSSDENLAARSSNAVRCPPGFQTDPGDLNRCMDIDECQLQLNDCTDDQECINEHGSYLCKDIPHRSKEVCPIGFHYNSQTKKCDSKLFNLWVCRVCTELGTTSILSRKTIECISRKFFWSPLSIGSIHIFKLKVEGKAIYRTVVGH